MSDRYCPNGIYSHGTKFRCVCWWEQQDNERMRQAESDPEMTVCDKHRTAYNRANYCPACRWMSNPQGGRG